MSRRYIASLLLMSVHAQLVSAASGPTLPTGGNFTAGSGNISASANSMTVNQSSARGIIDWASFSIGQGSQVLFNNGSGATLNRVNGGAMSFILGNLIASGTVYLINPEGVLIGPKGAVNTGGDFVASTLNISNSAFLNGGGLLFQGPSTALVKNLGAIYSQGGSVFLIARSVENDGTLNAPNGTVGLGAGQQILIKDSSADERVFVEAAGGDVRNRGNISAAEAELKTVDGNIYALAGNNGGAIRATGTTVKDGHVWLVATGGTTTVSSAISAQNYDGTGGSIETSGENVSVAGAHITTGQGGSWLLDPVDLTIDSPAATTIETALDAGTNVTEQTTATGASGSGTVNNSGSGDINVASSIAWNTGASLTLSAYRNININNGVTISNSSSGNLTLRADNAAAGTGTVNFLGTGDVNFSGSSGNVLFYYYPSSYSSPTDFTSNVSIGSGTFSPYMNVDSLSDLEALDAFSQATTSPVSGDYALNANINANTATNFAPIGNDWYPFSGIFDGQGHVIRNLWVNSSSYPYSSFGLFGYIANSGQVRNLSLTNELVDSPLANVGSLAGTNAGLIDSCSVTGSVTNTSSISQTGGLAGYNALAGTISNSYANIGVTASGYVGGLVGSNDYDATITNSFATGSVTSSAAYSNTGGLVGYSDGTITASYSTGLVTASNTPYSGGLVGFNDVDSSSTHSYWNSSTSGQTNGVGYCGSGDSCTSVYSATTAQLQGASLPSGFDSSVWMVVPGHYPQLSWGGANEVVSGTAFNGSTALASANVAGIAGGTVFDTATTDTNGDYSLFLPRGTAISGGVMTLLTTGGKANVFSDGGGNDSYTNLNLNSGILSLQNTANSTYSGLVSTLKSTIGNIGNSVPTVLSGPMPLSPGYPSDLLFTITGSSLNLKNGTNLSLISTNNSFTIDQSISATGTIFVNSSESLTLGNSVQLSAAGAGDALTLISGGSFTNSAGINPLLVTGGGRWLVYSQNPSNDSVSGLGYTFKQYDASYGATPAQSAGNGLLYSFAPVISVGLTGTTSKIYDTTNTATLNSANLNLTGEQSGDTVLLNISSSTYSDKNVGTNKTVTASGISIASMVDASGAVVYGYGLNSTTASGNIGAITPASLSTTVTANNKVYDGTTSATGTLSSLTGVLGNDNVSLNTAGESFSFADKNVGNGKTVSETGAFLSGSDANNYTLSVANGSADITPATLTYVSDPATRSFGTANPTFTGSVTGFVDGETIASATTGPLTFSTPAIASSAVGSYAINGSGLVANNGNYVFVQAPGNASALTIIAANSAPPPSTSTPTTTPIVLSINDATRLANQPNPEFSATYSGPTLSAPEMAQILADLDFQTTATTTSQPGVYQITALPIVVSEGSATYEVTIEPGSLTVVDNSTANLPTQVIPPNIAPTPFGPTQPPYTPGSPTIHLVFQGFAGGAAVGPNTWGTFEMNYSPAWTSALGSVLSSFKPIVESSFLTPGATSVSGRSTTAVGSH